jgi:DNA-binding transcriptional LysR family regulator
MIDSLEERVMKRPGLPAMNAFRRVVELQSFGAAGRSLEMTGGAVSKLVAQLEQDLGVRLLNRTTRSVSVTAEGAAFYETAARLLDDLDAAADALRGVSAAPGGRLKVSVPTSFALMWLGPRLPSLMLARPALQLDLALNDRFVDIVQEGFDCAVRIASQLPDSSLVARRLGAMQRLLVASPAYLRDAPPLRRPEDLQAHACLVYSQNGGPAEWPLGGARTIVVDGALRVNNSVMLRPLLLAGLGVTLTPEFVVADLVASGELEVLLPDHRGPPLHVHALLPHQRFVAHKVRVFMDWLEAELR